MSIEKVVNEFDIVNTDVKIRTDVKKRSVTQPEIESGDTVSIGNTPAADLTQIKWPPFFPIGDTQSIFKIKK